MLGVKSRSRSFGPESMLIWLNEGIFEPFSPLPNLPLRLSAGYFFL